MLKHAQTLMMYILPLHVQLCPVMADNASQTIIIIRTQGSAFIGIWFIRVKVTMQLL